MESISKTIPIPRFFIFLFVTAYNIRNILFCCLLVLNEIKRKIHFCAMFYKLDLVKPSLFIDHFIFIVFLIFCLAFFSGFYKRKLFFYIWITMFADYIGHKRNSECVIYFYTLSDVYELSL